tara:strand:+ start:84550 stop:84999 length:450 start_codon:yes stop_codon:yes gene_type:complete
MQMEYQKSSYLSCHQLLQESAQRCSRAASNLGDQIQHVSPPYDSAMREIQHTQDELAQLLLDFVHNGPEKVLQTRLQFSEQAPLQEACDTPGSSLKALIQTNQRINDELELQAPNFDTQDTREVFAALRQKVVALSRRISNIQVTERDV